KGLAPLRSRGVASFLCDAPGPSVPPSLQRLPEAANQKPSSSAGSAGRDSRAARGCPPPGAVAASVEGVQAPGTLLAQTGASGAASLNPRLASSTE
ncbi:unnamed protein product, partial [Gulo gulo]